MFLSNVRLFSIWCSTVELHEYLFEMALVGGLEHPNNQFNIRGWMLLDILCKFHLRIELNKP